MAQRTENFAEKQYISEASIKGGQASRNARKLFKLENDEQKRADWMYKAVRAKFAANTYLAKKLEATGETPYFLDMVKALLADGAYWREAVKRVPEFADDGNYCVFCDGPDLNLTRREPWHKRDCPWKLAQESE